MNLAQALTFVAYNLLRGSKTKLRHEAVQAWINEHANADAYGRGYMGGQLRKGPSKAFVEVTRTQNGPRYNVQASAYLDRRAGAVATKTWTSVTLDRQLEKLFDGKRRVTIPF